MAVHFKQVTIVGVGLIGGSLGLVLKQRAMADSIVGIGRRVENLKAAVQLGAIDRYVVDAKTGVTGADLVVLATPVDTYERHLKDWGHGLKPGVIVTDVGSVKGPLVEQAEGLMPAGGRFIGAHPIAGREKTGVAAGSADLFKGARCILTPTGKTDPQALQAVREMWEAAGSIVLSMDPFLHDRVLGAVSHLPHAAAFALMLALPSGGALWLFAPIAGLSWIATVPLTYSLTAEIYGLKNMGTLSGVITMSHQLGGAAAIFVAGWSFDRTGTYTVFWATGATLLVAASLIAFSVRERALSSRYQTPAPASRRAGTAPAGGGD
jgi:prephenate dehydrogenase